MKQASNPYTLVFGKEPGQLVSRYPEAELIVDSFDSDLPASQVFMLTGVRGSGKTVLMTSVAKHFKNIDNWHVIDLSPDLDLLNSFAAELGEINELKPLFRVEKLNISLPGISISFSGEPPVTNSKIAITRMLEVIKKYNHKILITIDEATNNESVRIFASVFQILLRQEFPVYLIMTGLYENIHSLQNEDTLTFLYRAPKIEMKPLNLHAMAENYKSTLLLSLDTAKEMARLTKGYPFAFQVLGYLTWNAKGDYKSVIQQYKIYLEEYVYEKILLEMSPKDRLVAAGIAKTEHGLSDEIKKELNLKQNEWNPYRKRLISKGIITAPERGRVTFTLPYFGEYLLDYIYGE